MLKQIEDKKVVYRGKEYQTMTEALRMLGIKMSTTTIKKRMKKHHMSFEEVIDADNRKFSTGNKYVYKGKEYYSLVELCKVLGIPESTMRKRLAKKMSIEEAIEKALSFDRSHQDHLGNKFKNIEEMY